MASIFCAICSPRPDAAFQIPWIVCGYFEKDRFSQLGNIYTASNSGLTGVAPLTMDDFMAQTQSVRAAWQVNRGEPDQWCDIPATLGIHIQEALLAHTVAVSKVVHAVSAESDPAKCAKLDARLALLSTTTLDMVINRHTGRQVTTHTRPGVERRLTGRHIKVHLHYTRQATGEVELRLSSIGYPASLVRKVHKAGLADSVISLQSLLGEYTADADDDEVEDIEDHDGMAEGAMEGHIDLPLTALEAEINGDMASDTSDDEHDPPQAEQSDGEPTTAAGHDTSSTYRESSAWKLHRAYMHMWVYS